MHSACRGRAPAVALSKSALLHKWSVSLRGNNSYYVIAIIAMVIEFLAGSLHALI